MTRLETPSAVPENVQRAADALHHLARETGSGYCPTWWEGSWREWYRAVARAVLAAADGDATAFDEMRARRKSKGWSA